MAILGSPLLPFPIPPVIKPLGCNKLVAASFVPVAVNSPARTKLDVATPPPVTIPAPLPVPVPPPRPFPFPLPLNRDSFPPGFYFGTSSAAYQYEGAARLDGRGASIWDVFTHKYPDRIADGSNGDVAVDFYHQYRGDVKLMKEMGTNAFRFSISWSRILPRGTLRGGVNEKGIQFYNDLIDELRRNGIEPFVTIFHWDVPYALEDEYGGFLSPRIVDDFRDFAELCFEKFGDRVKHWITLNEPNIFSSDGYDLGILAPGRCSAWVSEACEAGNSATEPYVVTHHLLLAHAAAVQVYKAHYQRSQKGEIGIAIVSLWIVPYSEKDPNDHDAAKRALDFMFGWYMDPMVHGDYPETMRTLVRERLPRFTEEQSRMLKGSFDFIGINYYTARYAQNVPVIHDINLSYSTDSHADLKADKEGIPIGPLGSSTWVRVYPIGLQDLLKYTKETYNNPTIYITENGVDQAIDTRAPLKEILEDDLRIDYYRRHLLSLLKSLYEDGVKVKGYFPWSLLDDFEWNSGYTSKFGIHYVDFNNGLTRYPKHSAMWFKKFLTNGIEPRPRDGEMDEVENQA